jgi:hypothetical protein
MTFNHSPIDMLGGYKTKQAKATVLDTGGSSTITKTSHSILEELPSQEDLFSLSSQTICSRETDVSMSISCSLLGQNC